MFLKAKNNLAKFLWSPASRWKILVTDLSNHPWANDIATYIEKNVFPCVKNHLRENTEGLLDIEARWLWDRPWVIRSSSETEIKSNRINHGDPISFIGGTGYWSLKLNDTKISPEDFVLITVWDDLEELMVTNLTSETFVNLTTTTILENHLERTRMVPAGTLEPFGIQASREVNKGHRDKFQVLRDELDMALKSLGYKKGDVDPEKLNKIVTKSINEDKATIEDCVNIFLKLR